MLVQSSEWPKDDETEKWLLGQITSSFERANEAGPVYGGLIKERVVLTKKDKPMARAGGKDTVQRKSSIELYEKEIELAYQHAEKLGLLWGEVADAGQLI